MTALSTVLRRHYEKWKIDSLTQSDFRPNVGILKMSAMAVLIGVAGAVVAWVLYRLIGLVTHLAFAGMAATFGTPIAATLVAIELLLFELRPRSTIPVAIACFVAAALRPF